MIRKTAFLVTGTVTGLVAVLSYNPPKLENAIAASGTSTPNASSTTNSTNNDASSATSTKVNTPAQPAAGSKKSSATTQNSNTTSPSSSTSPSTSTQSDASNTTTSTSDVSTTSTTATPKQSSGTSGTYKGETVQTRWGPVQVQITVSGGKITDVSTLQYPNGDRRSLMISTQVIPWLQQEALQVQSANISGVGGATYTSNGFRNSLASAIQKAGL